MSKVAFCEVGFSSLSLKNFRRDSLCCLIVDPVNKLIGEVKSAYEPTGWAYLVCTAETGIDGTLAHRRVIPQH